MKATLRKREDWLVPLSSVEATDAGRFGLKAANLAKLTRAGLPTPGGFALDAQAYRAQLQALGLQDAAAAVFRAEDLAARRHALEVRLGLMDRAIEPALSSALLELWERLAPAAPIAVRSSALFEDRLGSSFAGQFESFLGLDNESDFLTAVRSCWAALWSTRALRYMATHRVLASDTAMALVLQRQVDARVSGGGLSRTADDEMTLSATWGLGSAIAQGEIVPDRIVLGRDCAVREMSAGRKFHQVSCSNASRAVPTPLVNQPCLTRAEAMALGRMLLQCEDLVQGPAEIEWAKDDAGFTLLQARPLQVESEKTSIPIEAGSIRLRGHPAGAGAAAGRARVVACECELPRVGRGDILVTKVAGPGLAEMLTRVSGVVAELGGSTSHMASLARERGVPMVLGVLDATRRIADGSFVVVDGTAGLVHCSSRLQS